MIGRCNGGERLRSWLCTETLRTFSAARSPTRNWEVGRCSGHGAIGLLDGLYKQTDRIRHISPRIEQGAGFMADVYYRLTSQPLAVYASTGPGPMNLMISVTNAFYDASAFFVITGQVPTNQFNTGALQDDYRYHGDHVLDVRAHREEVRTASARSRICAEALPDAFSLMTQWDGQGPSISTCRTISTSSTAPVSTPEPMRTWLASSNWRSTVSDMTVEKALNLLLERAEGR